MSLSASWGMEFARDATGARVGVAAIDLDPQPFTKPLRCEWCTTAVRAVRSHTSTRAGRPFPVKGHFSLIGRAAQEAHHDDGCRLNPVDALAHIVRDSDDLAQALPDGRLRLILPDADSAAPTPPDPLAAPTVPDGAGTALHIHGRQPRLTAVVTAAAKVAQLLQLHTDDLLALFELSYQDRTIAWGDFCYGPGTQRLEGLYGRAAGRELSPVAVHGTVTRAGTDRGGRPYRIIATHVPTGLGSPHASADVYLRSEHPSLLAPLIVGRDVLALSRGAGASQWRVFRPASGARHQIVLWVQEHWQLAHWTTAPDTGLPTTPRTPGPVRLA